jgi:LmbE family N-acetylglucosaminyl deacetylase
MTVGEVLAAAHSLPLCPLRDALGDRPFIVVTPHPDDESLGCGGLIADACRQGVRGKVVIVGDGAGSHGNSKAYPPERLTALREVEARQAGRAGTETRGDAFPPSPQSFCPA